MTAFRLDALQRSQDVAELLVNAGMDGESSQGKSHLWGQAAGRLIGEGVSPTALAHACFVPGRIEVLGKHTDYAGGRSLLAVPQRGVCMVAAGRSDQQVRIRALDVDDVMTFPVSAELSATPGNWDVYPRTIARRLANNFPGHRFGANIAFCSDLPIAAGMSSSSALMIATFKALVACGNLEDSKRYREQISSREDLAMYLACVENGQSFRDLPGDRGVGTFGGSEDHTAILCCQSGGLKQYSFCPTRHEKSLNFPANYSFVIAASGVVAEKTGSAMAKYNRLSRLAAAVAEIWREATGRDDPHLAAVLDSSNDAIDRCRELLSQTRHGEFSSAQLSSRLEHFQAESCEIIPAAGVALADGRLAEFGRLVDRSQRLSVELLGNQVPETEFLAVAARQSGAIAASAFGAGFGGSVWAMVPDDQRDSFLSHWRESYASRFPTTSRHADFFATKPGSSAAYLTD